MFQNRKLDVKALNFFIRILGILDVTSHETVKQKGVHGAAAVPHHTAYISREPSLRIACESLKCKCDHLLIDLHISIPPDPEVVWNILCRRKNSVTDNLSSLKNIPVEHDQRWKLHLRHVGYNISLPSHEQNDSRKHSLIILILLCLHIGCWQTHSILPYSSASEENSTVCHRDATMNMVVSPGSFLTGNLVQDASWAYVCLLPQNAGRTRNQKNIMLAPTFFTVCICLHQLCYAQEH